MNDIERAVFTQKTDELVHALRVVGLFEDRIDFIDEERPVALVELLIGELAFSKRIQEPEQVDFDAEFRLMMAPVAEDQNTSAIEGLLEMLGES